MASISSTSLTISRVHLCEQRVFHSWEYPNKQGLGCNVISPSDSANFLLFLQALRASPGGSKIILSAAVGLAPFNGPDGTPMTDVSGFAAVLDYIGKYVFLLGSLDSYCYVLQQ